MNKDILKKLYKYCSCNEKCKNDIQKYLYNYNLEDEEILNLIKNLEENNFINEARYTEAFVNDKLKFNKWGKIKISYELKSKNIDSQTINKYINAIDENKYSEILISILKTKLKTLNKKDKNMQYLLLLKFGLSRGFEYEIVEKTIKGLIIILQQ